MLCKEITFKQCISGNTYFQNLLHLIIKARRNNILYIREKMILGLLG